MKLISYVLPLLLLLPVKLGAQNEALAKKILQKTLKLVENPGGIELDYRMKATRLFQQAGHAVFKGNKSFTKTKKNLVWFDGTHGWNYEMAKNTVLLFDETYKRHIGLGKQLEIAKTQCTYGVETLPTGLLLRLKVKNSSTAIHEAAILVDKTTYAPLEVRFKWMLFWFKVNIKNFKTGHFDDSLFSFPHQKYASAKIIDKRKK